VRKRGQQLLRDEPLPTLPPYPPCSSRAAVEQAQTRTAQPLIRLRSLPAASRGALAAYDHALLTATQTYLRVGALRSAGAGGRWGAAATGQASGESLPLSGLSFANTDAGGGGGDTAAGLLPGRVGTLVAPVVLRSPFSALRGRDDRFRSARELSCELRGGLMLAQGQTTPVLPDIKVRRRGLEACAVVTIGAMDIQLYFSLVTLAAGRRFAPCSGVPAAWQTP
jgi:hypothetical protein